MDGRGPGLETGQFLKGTMNVNPARHVVGFDTETFLIGLGAVVPSMVCLSYDDDQGTGQVVDATGVIHARDSGTCMAFLSGLFRRAQADQLVVAIHNASFDVTVLMLWCLEIIQGRRDGDKKEARELLYLIWAVLDENMDRELAGGRPSIACTLLREKLWNLSSHGSLENDRHGRDLRFSLADLVKQYYDTDISATKTDPDAWRLRYSELDPVPVKDWPKAAYQYALDDATWAKCVWYEQEKKRAPAGYGSMNSEALQVAADVALRLISSAGWKMDRAAVEKLRSAIADQLSPAKLKPLYDCGIVRPNNTVDTKALQERVRLAWEKKGGLVRLTPKEKVACGAAVFTALHGTDPILDLYEYRAEFQKILTAFIPNISNAVTYFNFDVLKETGRTSSYGNSERSTKRAPLYPAVNGQQLPKYPGVREAFVARPGYLISSNDYGALELCSTAQATYSILGHSVHRDKINAGYDLHSFLGAALASKLEPGLVNGAADLDDAYSVFMKKRKADDETTRKRANHFRSLAKPVGLGFPGGMGPRTMREHAKVVYGVEMSEQEATLFQNLWFEVYPEMREFFRWVNDQIDNENNGWDEERQQRIKLYAYETTGYNRFRAGATFCATANGKAMQSLSADGAKRSFIWLCRAQFGGYRGDDPLRLLEGVRHLNFVHDENLNELPDDDLATERAMLMSWIMIEAMRVSMPDVRISVEPALMRAWSKAAGDAVWREDQERSKRLEAAGIKSWGLPQEVLAPLLKGRRLIPFEDRPKKTS